ncbi:hypothetical protein PNI0010_02259 [Streptococcus pneumoniae PNI0010]|nr:hypothetical protein PNI0006_00735 [Streptococcus pneumoniae PNI0006]ELU74938.1 hypothetical protein PNI0010_02259 [Streptococcus pneumoniae PNI0010]ELU86813.1 hypothetical protein PNI0199_00602 [Streptococcus pneumoniae PNI0199]ELU87458.1 hypothetical protein PNI0360_01456 [Streptococcus pneumoniae PNI0360]
MHKLIREFKPISNNVLEIKVYYFNFNILHFIFSLNSVSF